MPTTPFLPPGPTPAATAAPVAGAFRALTSAEAALGLAFDVFTLEPGAAVVALVERRPPGGGSGGRGVAVALRGASVPVRAVLALAGAVVSGAGPPGDGRARVAYVSLLGPGVPPLSRARLRTWGALRRLHRRSAVALLDWMVLAPGEGVTSLAEEAGRPPDW